SPGYGGTNKNFLAYGGNGANARMFQRALSLDLLGASEHAHRASAGMAGKTVFENLRDNYFGVYELNYKKSRHTLYNHTTAIYANEIAQGVLFGKPELLREGIEVVMTWLDQCLTRDGQYYENAGGYERVGVNYFGDMILPLDNYSPRNYDNPQDFPDPAKYPFALRFGNDPRWYSAAFLMKYRMMASGRMICFGDMWEDRLVLPGRTRDWDPRNWCVFARLLYAQTDRPEWKEELARRYWRLPDDVRNEPVVMSIRGMGMSQWFEPPKPKGGEAADACLLDEPSDFLPGKMIALMRKGAGENHRTAFMCGSVHYSHGSDAQMELILYAKGMCLTGIYGYPFAGSPAHRGWSIKPASRWTLIVNEDLPVQPYPAKNSPPASLQALTTDRTGLSVQAVEMSNPRLWTANPAIAPDMTEYRRLLWMVDVSDEDFYFLDFFRVHGGHTHDYLWTGQWLDQLRPSEGFAVEGVQPESVEGVWSLAGFNRRYRKADYNVPGRSWGERLESGKSGSIASLGIPGEEINVDRNWNPPPGNGYGFIYDVRAAQT
ncbi:MAG TPA: heparinase, partial [Candidatus Hydrogenedentes bacterium]|nr:heparinase [Candidatus Hydrogenedentota bacterium]